MDFDPKNADTISPSSSLSSFFTTTDHQAVFWAWELSKRSQEDSYARIAGSMMGAQVDLNPHQIDAAFGQLQLELDETISQTMSKAQIKVMGNLDEEVHQRLKLWESEALAIRGWQQRALYYLTKHLLAFQATRDDTTGSFRYKGEAYSLQIDEGTLAHSYRIQHPLAQNLLEQTRHLHLEPAELTFHYTGKPVIGVLKELIGRCGWLQLQATTDFQRQIVQEEAQRRQQSYFSTEIDKLDLWAEDLKNGLELRIKELETERNLARKRLFEAQDEIDAKRDEIIAETEGQLAVVDSCGTILRCGWRIDE